jgi:hypothetical protein
MDHEDRLAEARRKLERGEDVDEITLARVIRANVGALATLQAILRPTPPPVKPRAQLVRVGG